MGQKFMINEHPKLKDSFKDYFQKVTNKYVSLEKYFEKIGENLEDYIILAHGPIFGIEDPRDGYIMSNIKTDELISVPDEDIPIITKVDDCLFADTIGYLKTQTKIESGIYTDLRNIEKIREEYFLNNKDRFNIEFVNDWEPSKTFLLIK